MNYKTRNNSNPKGKPKVYFACHPDEFNVYFDSVTDDILKKYNCSIYYYKSYKKVEIDSLLNDISMMQLVVIAVTTNFLSTKNIARDVIFKYANEQHIPILPLMQEEGLEELFNAVCGELQTLNKNVIDPTAINYNDKLEKYLNSVLISDELSEKIRNAFDAYIFLSYRKKDRKYAQELMKLIHKNDFCRDIAIWYDEFLVPGENFNDAIADALAKSKLFALVVTPNLINEENYVMTTEYPMAKERKIHIIPTESVETDKEELKAKFADIPESIDVHNEKLLSDSMLQAIKSLAIKSNDSSPEHNFFIGLAYLSGIDVEVDYDCALNLIKSAAEAGLVEAIEKIAEMYLNGNGVARNKDEAVKWLNKLLEARNRTFSETLEYSDGVLIVEVYEKLGDVFFQNNQLTEAERYYYKMYHLATGLLDEEACEEKKFNNIVKNKMYNELSDDDFKKMVNHFKKTTMEMDKQKQILRHSFLKSSYLLGKIDAIFGNYDNAIKIYNMTLFYIDKYSSSNFNTIEYLCNIGLSDIYYEIGCFHDVLEVRKKAFHIIDNLVKMDSSEENLIKLSEAYDKLGDICYDMQLFKEAEDFYHRALGIRQNELTDKDSNKLLVACSYYNLSLCKNNKEAYEYQSRSLKILMELAVPGGIFKAYEYIVYVATKICSCRIDAALDSEEIMDLINRYYIVVNTGCKVLSTMPPTVSVLRTIMNSYVKFSYFFARVGKNEIGFRLAEETVKYSQKICELLPESQNAKEDEYMAHIAMAEAYRSLKNITEAKKHYDFAWTIIKEIMKNGIEGSVRNETIFYDCAYLLYSCGKMLSGREQAVYYVKAHKLAVILCKQYPQNEEYNSIKKAIEYSIRNRKK